MVFDSVRTGTIYSCGCDAKAGSNIQSLPGPFHSYCFGETYLREILCVPPFFNFRSSGYAVFERQERADLDAVEQLESMEDTEEQESLSRRSSGRRRKSPHRFVAEAATSRVGGDFVQPKRRERPQPPPLEELQVSPESLLNRRVAVSHLQDL